MPPEQEDEEEEGGGVVALSPLPGPLRPAPLPNPCGGAGAAPQ